MPLGSLEPEPENEADWPGPTPPGAEKAAVGGE